MRAKLTTEQIYERYHDLTPDQEAKGARAEYRFNCLDELGHGSYLQKLNDHYSGQGCPTCAGNQKMTTQQMYERFPDLVPNQEARGVDNKYRFICPTGHDSYFQKLNHHRSGHSCPACAGVERLTTLAGLGHGSYSQTYANHSQGAGCPKCCESRGEKRIAVFGFEREKRFVSCRNILPLPFDFAAPGVLIEFHGEQHYRKWLGGLKKFRGTQRHDAIKRRWAARNLWKLITIKYTKLNDVEGYLIRRLAMLSPDYVYFGKAARLRNAVA
jgi:hypothetical protein